MVPLGFWQLTHSRQTWAPINNQKGAIMYLQNDNPKTKDLHIRKFQSEYYIGNPYLYADESQLQKDAEYKAELDKRAKQGGLDNLLKNARPSTSDIAPEISRCERLEDYDYLTELSGNSALLKARDLSESTEGDLSDSARAEIWGSTDA